MQTQIKDNLNHYFCLDTFITKNKTQPHKKDQPSLNRNNQERETEVKHRLLPIYI